jgi:transposase
MFVRINRNASGHQYLQILRSYRQDGKVKQEVLLTLGRLDVLQATGQLDALVSALARHCTREHLIDLSKDVSVDQVYHLGTAYVISRMMEKLGLKRLLERLAAKHPQMVLPWVAIITGMILSRFIEPCSKRRLNQDQWERIYPGILETPAPPLKSFYRAMDTLWEHKDDIEMAVFDKNGQRDLFNQDLDLVFYDLTTLYFESANAQDGDLRRFGYSKEHRSDCTQVVLGLLVDKDGVPVGYQLFPGNTGETKTLAPILEKLKNKYRIQNVIMVADRGLISEKNVDELRQSGMGYILGKRLWAMSETEQAVVLDKSKYRKLDDKGEVLIRETLTADGDRLILTWSKSRAERDAKLRNAVLDRIRTQIKKATTAKRFVTHKGYRQYLKGLDGGSPCLDYDAIAQSEKRDGFFGVVTGVSKEQLRAEDVFDRYRDLWRVEDAFGEIKGPLETRPMFHWVDRRIQSHVLLCLLAYYVEAVITRDLRKAKAAFTTGEFFRALNHVHAVPVDVRGSRAWVRTEMRGLPQDGCRFLQLKMPERVLKIEKIGSDGSVVTQNLTDISKPVAAQSF